MVLSPALHHQLTFRVSGKVGHLTRFFYCTERAEAADGFEDMLTAKEQSLLDAVEAHAEAHGISIVTVEVAGASKSPVIRVYIDALGGVSFTELTEAQEWIGQLMDELDPFPGAYVLEVSSPGIDRPLRTPGHFQAAVGEQVKLKTSEAVEGRKHFKGTLVSATEDAVAIEVDGAEVALPFTAISKANIIGTVKF